MRRGPYTDVHAHELEGREVAAARSGLVTAARRPKIKFSLGGDWSALTNRYMGTIPLSGPQTRTNRAYASGFRQDARSASQLEFERLERRD